MKLITTILPSETSNSLNGLFTYISSHFSDNVEYYYVGKAVRKYDSLSFDYVINPNLELSDWWSENTNNSFFEIYFVGKYAIKITNYTVLTFNGINQKQPPCGLKEWVVEISNNKFSKTQEYHSNSMHQYRYSETFSITTPPNEFITKIKLTQIENSRGNDNYLAMSRFEIFGSLYDLKILCTQSFYTFILNFRCLLLTSLL